MWHDGGDVAVRDAVPDDIGELIGLLKSLFAIEADFEFDERNQRKGLEMMIRDSARCFIKVAEQTVPAEKGAGRRIVGMCTAQLVVSTAEGGLSALVEDMVVDEKFRGAGTGRKLLQSLEEKSKAMGATRMQLLADRNNRPAFGFYGRMNWKETQLVCMRKHV